MNSRILYGVRERKSRARWRAQASAMLVVAGIIAAGIIGVAAAVFMPALRIKNISISGLETVDEHEIRASIDAWLDARRFFILPRRSYLLADPVGLASALRAAFPAISHVGSEKAFPASLAVTVAERRFWGVLCNGLQTGVLAQCVAVDTTGFAYETSPRPQGNLILVSETDRADLTAGRQQIEPSLMARLLIVQEGVAQATGGKIAGFELRDRASQEIRARTAEGFYIYFRRDDDFANAFRVLKKILDAEIGERRRNLAYIDVRFGNKIFYKFR